MNSTITKNNEKHTPIQAKVSEEQANIIVEKSKTSELKKILTDALLGKQDAKESIEKLSSVLFPEENLIQAVQSMKIKEELNSRLSIYNQKGIFTTSDITQIDNVYTFDLNFNDTKKFNSIHHNISEICVQVSEKYKVDIRPNIHISQTFSCYQKEKPTTNFVLSGVNVNSKATAKFVK